MSNFQRQNNKATKKYKLLQKIKQLKGGGCKQKHVDYRSKVEDKMIQFTKCKQNRKFQRNENGFKYKVNV